MPLYKSVSRRNPVTGEWESRRVELTAEEEAAVVSERAEKGAELARRSVAKRIRDHAQAIILSDFSRLTSWDQTEAVLGTIAEAVIPAARSPKLTSAVAVYLYARGLVAASRGWSKAQADAYDPAKDTDWP